jgi:tetratricopeptide (TPR) repeat protein
MTSQTLSGAKVSISPSSQQSTSRARGSEVPRMVEYIAGIPERRKTWTSQSWVLHAALTLLGNERHINASIDVISIDFFTMRHVQRAVRFTQSALHAKKQNEAQDKVILLWKNARMQLKRIWPDMMLGQLHLVEVDCSLAAETALVDVKPVEKLDGEVSSVLTRLGGMGFAPEEIDFENMGIESLVDGIARAFNAIGAAWERLGYIDQALKRKQQSLAVFRHVHRGRVHVNVAALLSNVGLILEMRGDRAAAIDFKRRGLDMLCKLTEGRDDERVATAMNNLGVSVQDNGDRQTGIDLQRAALEMRQRLFGQDRDHEKIASSLNNLGAALETSNDRARGIELLRRGLAMNERVHPSGHKNLAMNLANLGSGLMHLGTESALREARTLLDRAVTMFTELRAAHEADGEDIAIAQNNLALVKDRLGDAEGALKDKQKALDIRKAMHGDRDVASVATSMSCVGESLMRLNQPAEAARGKQILRDAVAMFERLRNYSLEALLAASALFFLDTKETNIINATRLLPMLTQAIELAPSFHRSQLCMSFAHVLEEALPTTSNLLRLQHDAAEFAGAAESAKIRSILAQTPNSTAVETTGSNTPGVSNTTDTPAAPDTTAALWEYLQNIKITRLAARSARHFDPSENIPTQAPQLYDDGASVATADSVAQEAAASDASTKTGSIASSSEESVSQTSTQCMTKDKKGVPEEADVKHAQSEQQQLAHRMVGEAMAVCIAAAKTVPVMQRAKPADTLAAVRQAISATTPLSIDLVSRCFR